MVKAVTATAAEREISVPRAWAATRRTPASRIQLGKVHSAASPMRPGDMSASSARRVSNLPRSGRGIRTSTDLNRSRVTANAAASTTATGMARPRNQSSRASNDATNAPNAAAMIINDAKSSRRATAVEAAASVSGTPRRAASNGRAASPSLNGSRWLARSAACK